MNVIYTTVAAQQDTPFRWLLIALRRKVVEVFWKILWLPEMNLQILQTRFYDSEKTSGFLDYFLPLNNPKSVQKSAENTKIDRIKPLKSRVHLPIMFVLICGKDFFSFLIVRDWKQYPLVV